MIKITKSLAAFDANSNFRRAGRALLRAAGFALALGALAAPASAKPFQQYLNGTCTGTICKINFAKVPAGLRLTVVNASCYIRLGRGAGGAELQMRAAQFLVIGANPNTIVSAVTIVPQLIERTGLEEVMSANHATTVFVGPQQRVQAFVELFSGSFSQVACHVSGDLAKA